ncbi:MAG: hypothetical protein F4029_20215 [Gammaproteobacteria bacterium]|nr:hypothetical protein [Gammaproteobacteria bacterium]MYF31699.1 hypothetical protein [Gammaproteobacteria bacterium]MYK48539.1 hypothetical protein [Gammaproteobacteria bacterium]
MLLANLIGHTLPVVDHVRRRELVDPFEDRVHRLQVAVQLIEGAFVHQIDRYCREVVRHLQDTLYERLRFLEVVVPPRVSFDQRVFLLVPAQHSLRPLREVADGPAFGHGAQFPCNTSGRTIGSLPLASKAAA